MNPAWRAAAETVQHTWIMGVATVLFLGCFVLWTVWAFAPRNRQRLDEASRMPLSEDNEP